MPTQVGTDCCQIIVRVDLLIGNLLHTHLFCVLTMSARDSVVLAASPTVVEAAAESRQWNWSLPVLCETLTHAVAWTRLAKTGTQRCLGLPHAE